MAHVDALVAEQVDLAEGSHGQRGLQLALEERHHGLWSWARVYVLVVDRRDPWRDHTGADQSPAAECSAAGPVRLRVSTTEPAHATASAIRW